MIGLAHPKRECWVLAGFEPQNQEESQRLEETTTTLGFDPRTAAERLSARRPPSDLRNAKRVLDDLTGGDWDRQADCWRKTDLGTLADRGRSTGLADYLTELRQRLVPLFTARPRPS